MATTLPRAAAGERSQPSTPRRARPGDPLLLVAVGLLLLLGLLAIFSAGATTALTEFDDQLFYLKRQMLWLALGLGTAGLAAALDLRLWQRWSVLLFFGTVALLVLLLGVAGPIHGGSRWLLASGSVQPSELAKLTVIVYLADWLSERRDEIREWALGIVPYSILMGIVCGLIILQRDYSTAVLVLVVASAMFFVAGAQLRQMLLAGSAAGIVLLGFLVSEQYRIERVRTFLDPARDPYDAGWQTLRALESFRAGGWVGSGLGHGMVKHGFPTGTAHTDAIFAVIGEEAGVLGCLLVIALFAIVAWRGYRIAAGAPDRFSGLLAVGITTWFVLQGIINMAVAARLLPFTGIPMPFVSFGGSSLVMTMAGVGLLHQIATRGEPAKARIHAPVHLGRRDRRSRLSRHHRARRAGRSG